MNEPLIGFLLKFNSIFVSNEFLYSLLDFGLWTKTNTLPTGSLYPFGLVGL